MEDSQSPSQALIDLGVQSDVKANNVTDENQNPTGGTVNLRIGERNPLRVQWQDGPRGNEDGKLGPSNGAFVEDVIWAALQRLEFFQTSKYADDANAVAVSHLHQALEALNARRVERANRGVEGKHEV